MTDEDTTADLEKLEAFFSTMSRADLRLAKEINADLIELFEKYSDAELAGERDRFPMAIFGTVIELVMQYGYCEHKLASLVHTIAAAQSSGMGELALKRERELTALRLVEAPKPVLGLKEKTDE